MDIVSFLQEKGEITYIDLIEPLREGTAEVLLASEAGVLIRINGNTLCCALFEERALPAFVEHLVVSNDSICVHDGPLIGYLKEKGLVYHLGCIQAVYTSKEKCMLSAQLTIQRLGLEDLAIVLEHYKHADREYITDRVASGCMRKAVVDGRLAAFIGRHAEGTIGMLQVLPDFRRRHIGEELEKAYVNLLLDEGRVPYCHVDTHNAASLALQKKLGMSFSKEIIHWFN
ncbi:MAG: GNAT family N-acetyltransferase [Spirochaetia bacterium]|nr:GNAT family N-acetyltransferase [Spirochaetia bacterium]